MLNRHVLNRRLNRITATGASIAILLFPGFAFGELWQLSPSITLEERYDDNIRLTTAPHDSVTGTLLRGKVGFSRLTENSGVTGRIHIDLSDYSGDEVRSDNNNNLFLSMASHYGTELTRWGLDGSFKRDTTLRGVDIVQDPVDDLPDDTVPGDNDVDAGIVNVDIRRHTLKLLPSWEHKYTERTNLSMGYSYIDVRYQNNPTGSGLFDYDQNSISARISHRLTERDVISTSIGLLHFQSPDNADNKADSYDFTVGYNRAFTEIMSGSIDVGVNYAEQKSNVFSSDTSGYVLRLNLNRKTEQRRFNLAFRHDLAPSGSGFITESNRLSLNIIHNFTKRLRGILDVRYTDREPVSDPLANTNRNYSVQPKLSWKLSRWWTVTGGYRYRSNDNDGNVETADSNAVFLSISHNKRVTFD